MVSEATRLYPWKDRQMKESVSPYVAERIVRKRDDFRVDTFRAGGKGGQNQNKVESGVRITDLVTGLSAEAREGRSQLQNKRKAFHRLTQKLIGHYRAEETAERLKKVAEQIGLRPIRTYKDKTVKDHRTGKVYDRRKFMDGDLEEALEDYRMMKSESLELPDSEAEA
jgi:peptide chain release factor 2